MRVTYREKPKIKPLVNQKLVACPICYERLPVDSKASYRHAIDHAVAFQQRCERLEQQRPVAI